MRISILLCVQRKKKYIDDWNDSYICIAGWGCCVWVNNKIMGL